MVSQFWQIGLFNPIHLQTRTSDKQKGGNQTELYQGNAPKKNLLKAKMLEAVWPQYTKTVIRFGRHHHLIDWKQYKKK